MFHSEKRNAREQNPDNTRCCNEFGTWSSIERVPPLNVHQIGRNPARIRQSGRNAGPTITYGQDDGRRMTWCANCSNREPGDKELMLRIVLGVSALGALLVTYWVHPTAAWIVLGSTFTLAVAFKVRQRDEAEGALQTIDE